VVTAKTSIFDVPTLFWQAGLDSFYFKDRPSQGITFAEFAANRDNYEYIKEFNRLNGYQPHYILRNSLTGDTFQVNKGFVMGVTDDEEQPDQDSNRYQFLAESEEFSAQDIDFSDPTALLRRQKAILEAIQKHQASE
jgi:hypothetical protein